MHDWFVFYQNLAVHRILYAADDVVVHICAAARAFYSIVRLHVRRAHTQQQSKWSCGGRTGHQNTHTHTDTLRKTIRIQNSELHLQMHYPDSDLVYEFQYWCVFIPPNQYEFVRQLAVYICTFTRQNMIVLQL